MLCSTYLDRLAEEVNDKLQEAGLISIAELCKSYDLPGDFLTEVSHADSLHTAMRVCKHGIYPILCGKQVKTTVCSVMYFRSCRSVSASSSKERWTSTTEGSYSLQLLLLATKPRYEVSSAPSHGSHHSYTASQ